MKKLRLIVCVLASGILGCSGEPAVIPVTGVVTYGGKPLAGADVAFVPVNEGVGGRPVAVAVTDADGKFSLRTNFAAVTREGAVAGDHAVTISKFVPPENMTEEAYRKRAQADDAARAKGPYNPDSTVPARVQLLPAEYSDGTKTTLKAKVMPSGPQVFSFELK